MLDRDNWTPHNIVIGLVVLFVVVWAASGQFMAGVLVVALVVLRSRTVRSGLRQLMESTPTLHGYRESRYDPFATPVDKEAELGSMPRYSEGRIVPVADTLERPPVRSYEADEDERSSPPPLARPAVSFSKPLPPKKPVELPRHRS